MMLNLNFLYYAFSPSVFVLPTMAKQSREVVFFSPATAFSVTPYKLLSILNIMRMGGGLRLSIVLLIQGPEVEK